MVGEILAALGPSGILVTIGLLIARGTLVPRYVMEQRLADKQQLVEYHKETSARVLEAAETREQNVELWITQLTELTKDLRTGRER